jgi:hypothetical protein
LLIPPRPGHALYCHAMLCAILKNIGTRSCQHFEYLSDKPFKRDVRIFSKTITNEVIFEADGFSSFCNFLLYLILPAALCLVVKYFFVYSGPLGDSRAP